MNKSSRILVIIASLVIVAGIAAFLWWNFTPHNDTKTSSTPDTVNNTENTKEAISNEYVSAKNVKVIVDTPTKNQSVSVPFSVSGQVPGNWSMEADFSIELLDQDGNSLATATAHVTGDWMTEDLVPFTATFDSANLNYTGDATLVLRKANSSGMPSNDDSVMIAIKLQ